MCEHVTEGYRGNLYILGYSEGTSLFMMRNTWKAIPIVRGIHRVALARMTLAANFSNGGERAGEPSTTFVRRNAYGGVESAGKPTSSTKDVGGISHREVEPAGGCGPSDARNIPIAINSLTYFRPRIDSSAAANSRALGRRRNRKTQEGGGVGDVSTSITSNDRLTR